jgi:hypothetical protein
MTNLQIFESGLNSNGELEQVIRLCENCGDYCLIGGLAVNAYCEPVFTADADIVLAVEDERLNVFREGLKKLGFKTNLHKYWLLARRKDSGLRIQVTRDEIYNDFPVRARKMEVFGISAMVASVEDLVKGKLMAYLSKEWSEAKKAKDRLDLIRLGVGYFDRVGDLLPEDVRQAVEKDLAAGAKN